MIILEGPDGGGKTTLLEQLSAHYTTIQVNERASTSGAQGGPVADLYEWAHRDVHSWRDADLRFYDRHPFVSEYIYGPAVRGHVDPRFFTTPLRRRVQHRALLVLCLPPLEAVRASVSAERDMAGVATHIDTIWHLYASLRASWPLVNFVHFDWTKHKPEDVVFPEVNHHRTHWSVTR